MHGFWNRNPDYDIRRLERAYQNSGSIGDAAQLMRSYFRTGEVERCAELLQFIEDQYAQLGIKDLGLEAIIVSAHLGLGRKSVDLCGGGYGSVVCRYNKTIIWDVMRGYPIGTAQGWINAINSYLVQMGWVDSEPTLFEDIVSPDRTEAFEAQKEPKYAIALFHEQFLKDSSMFRVIWRNVYLPQIEADYMEHRGRGWDDAPRRSTFARTDILLEDEPIARDYYGPKICTGYIKQAGSGGRATSGDSFTLRVPLQVGVHKALLTVEKLAYRIYFAKDWQEASSASGTGLYWPD
jgi:hypothetical protein